MDGPNPQPKLSPVAWLEANQQVVLAGLLVVGVIVASRLAKSKTALAPPPPAAGSVTERPIYLPTSESYINQTYNTTIQPPAVIPPPVIGGGDPHFPPPPLDPYIPPPPPYGGCVPRKCSPGDVFNPLTCQCDTPIGPPPPPPPPPPVDPRCNPGFEICRDQCVPVCPPGSHRDDWARSCNCIPDHAPPPPPPVDSRCGPGFEICRDQCVPVCPQGSFRDNWAHSCGCVTTTGGPCLPQPCMGGAHYNTATCQCESDSQPTAPPQGSLKIQFVTSVPPYPFATTFTAGDRVWAGLIVSVDSVTPVAFSMRFAAPGGVSLRGVLSTHGGTYSGEMFKGTASRNDPATVALDYQIYANNAGNPIEFTAGGFLTGNPQAVSTYAQIQVRPAAPAGPATCPSGMELCNGQCYPICGAGYIRAGNCQCIPVPPPPPPASPTCAAGNCSCVRQNCAQGDIACISQVAPWAGDGTTCGWGPSGGGGGSPVCAAGNCSCVRQNCSQGDTACISRVAPWAGDGTTCGWGPNTGGGSAVCNAGNFGCIRNACARCDKACADRVAPWAVNIPMSQYGWC